MSKFIKNKLSVKDQLVQDKKQFGSRQHMIDTLHLAYQYILDNIEFENKFKKLSKSDNYKLGRRLFDYWKYR
ncbi:MAG: hypothetical protein AABY22_33880 [Nanoarchaeota archaeon]|mgnify:CR=1 FL=1